VFGRVLDAAIGLLPHLEEPVCGISRVGIVGETFPFKRERPVGERIKIIDPCVWIGLDESLGEAGGRAGGQQDLISRLQ